MGSLAAPGIKVPALETAASLLDLGIWSLREQGLADYTQVRPVETSRVTVMGGRSFSRVTVSDPSAERPGLEGALLAAWRDDRQSGLRGLDSKLGRLLSPDDDDGTRGLILSLGLSSGSPWNTVANHCRAEAEQAGLIEVTGRLRKKVVVTDPDGLAALEPRNAEIAAARDRYREEEPELADALFYDCVTALDWAHTGSSS